MYGAWGLYRGLPISYTRRAKARTKPNGIITSMDDAFAVSRMRETRLSGSMWRGPETERWRTLHGHEAGNGGNSQGLSLHTTAPVPDPTPVQWVPSTGT